MKNWNQFGVIDTIYEEEREFSSTSSSSLSPSFSSSPQSLHSTVNAWSVDSGCEPDVLIHVQGTCFRLHKERMISKSTYLKRHLTSGISDFTLSPPLNITAETFTTVTEFSYGRKIQLKPTNVAAVITAAELLGMKEGDINLRDVAESVFERIVCVEAVTVLRSCLSLFPEVETTSSIVSRCIETVILENEDMDEESVLDVIVEMEHRDFESVVYSLNGRLENHDVLYKLVDLYLKENKYDKLTDEQKTEICNSIDCTKLSPLILVDCVQNPIMPLRFIVRAILAEHLTTRRTITEAATTTAAGSFQQQVEVHRISLREFLQLDTTRRQNAQLKEAMNSTYSRIQTLEKELSCMKKILQDHQAEEEKEKEKEKAKEKELENSVLNSERSASFHVLPIDENSKIRRGGRGSVSSSGFVLDNMIKKNNEMVKYKYNVNSSEGSCHEGNDTQKRATSFRHRFITGLKNTFKIPNSSSNLKDHHQ